MKQVLLLLALQLCWITSPLLAGNNLAYNTTALSSGNPSSISKNARMTTDPFIGVFTMSAYGQTMGTVTITHAGGNQYKIDTGDGHDMATKNGLVLEGSSQGIPFRILINGNNLIMELLGSNIDLTRISEQLPASEPSVANNEPNNSNNQSQSDPFTGTFEMFGDNGSFGNVTIINTGGANYELSSASGSDVATKSGRQLNGMSDGHPFTITINGNDLSYNTQGVTMQFRRKGITQIGQPTAASKTLDTRLLGVWEYIHIRKSGAAQMVTQYRIGFKKDGTYNTKTEWAGMGSSGEDPQQYGQYQIVSMDESGGVVRLDGKDQEYFFLEGV